MKSPSFQKTNDIINRFHHGFFVFIVATSSLVTCCFAGAFEKCSIRAIESFARPIGHQHAKVVNEQGVWARCYKWQAFAMPSKSPPQGKRNVVPLLAFVSGNSKATSEKSSQQNTDHSCHGWAYYFWRNIKEGCHRHPSVLWSCPLTLVLGLPCGFLILAQLRR